MKDKVSQWGSWDIKSLNAVMNLHHLMELKIGVYDDLQKTYTENMHPHRHVSRYGLHAADGSYFEIEYKIADFVFTAEFAAVAERFVVKLVPKSQSDHTFYYLSAHLMWNSDGCICKKTGALELSNNTEVFRITASGREDTAHRYYFNAPGLLLSASEAIYIFCNMEQDCQHADALLSAGRDKVVQLISRQDAESQKAVDAICKVMTWNTVYDPYKDRIITPVTRLWCLCDNAEFSVFGCYVLFCWDTFFNGLLAAEFDKDLAYQQIDTILSEATDRGMIPNTNAHRKKSLDRSQPPVGSFCVWKLYEKYGDADFLRKSFDGLYRWNRYWFRYRDPNNDGLLEWGSDPYPDGLHSAEYAKMNYSHTLAAAKLESGLDNSPMYDEVTFDKELNVLDLNDVGLNSLYALDLLCLAKIAAVIGEQEKGNALRAEYEQMKQRINALLWNDELGIYTNRFWNGETSDVLSPTNFYPMLAGIPDAKQTERMITEHLLNEEEFWGEYVLPSISRKAPGYADDKYWRGRIWAPMNYLVLEGLLASGRYSEAELLARKSYSMFMREWDAKHIISENYHPNGEAADDPFYTWGALLAYCKLCADRYNSGNDREKA